MVQHEGAGTINGGKIERKQYAEGGDGGIKATCWHTKSTVNSEQMCQLTALLDRKNLHRHYQGTIPIPLQLYLCRVVLPIIPFSLANWQAKWSFTPRVVAAVLWSWGTKLKTRVTGLKEDNRRARYISLRTMRQMDTWVRMKWLRLSRLDTHFRKCFTLTLLHGRVKARAKLETRRNSRVRSSL